MAEDFGYTIRVDGFTLIKADAEAAEKSVAKVGKALKEAQKDVNEVAKQNYTLASRGRGGGEFASFAEERLSNAYGINAGAPGGKGGVRGFQTANIAAQFQDIAVQAQMGAKWTTIIAQQGSQLLSAFGTGGAIIGGAVAIGGALAAVGQSANAAFDAAIKGADDFHASIEKVVASGSVEDIAKALGKVAEQQKALDDQKKGGFLTGALGVLTGGDSRAEKQSQLLLKNGQLYWDNVKASNALVEASDEELNITILRAAGQKDVADAMQSELATKRAIAAIDAMPISDPQKEALQNNVRRAAEAKQEYDAQQARRYNSDKMAAAETEARVAEAKRAGDEVSAIEIQRRQRLEEKSEAIYRDEKLSEEARQAALTALVKAGEAERLQIEKDAGDKLAAEMDAIEENSARQVEAAEKEKERAAKESDRERVRSAKQAAKEKKDAEKELKKNVQALADALEKGEKDKKEAEDAFNNRRDKNGRRIIRSRGAEESAKRDAERQAPDQTAGDAIYEANKARSAEARAAASAAADTSKQIADTTQILSGVLGGNFAGIVAVLEAMQKEQAAMAQKINALRQ